MNQGKEVENNSSVNRLQNLLEENHDKRVVVVGTTCTGKSTYVSNINGTLDMDKLVFPKLTKEEANYVNTFPWTPEIGREMERLTRKYVTIEKGKPVFGTIVLDSDLVIYLKIDDELLRERTAKRKTNFTDAKNMQQHIEESINESGIPMVEFNVR